jgi:guanyl-specific ribonuclease Sa
MPQVRRPLLVLVLLGALLAGGYAVRALHRAGPPGGSASSGTAAGLPHVPLASLPAEAAETYREIRAGGPYRYARDGIVFDNRGGPLPAEPRGYYREYTVPTPGESDRGARRLIAGQGGEVYYTGDHYASFVVVDVGGG